MEYRPVQYRIMYPAYIGLALGLGMVASVYAGNYLITQGHITQATSQQQLSARQGITVCIDGAQPGLRLEMRVADGLTTLMTLDTRRQEAACADLPWSYITFGARSRFIATSTGQTRLHTKLWVAHLKRPDVKLDEVSFQYGESCPIIFYGQYQTGDKVIFLYDPEDEQAPF